VTALASHGDAETGGVREFTSEKGQIAWFLFACVLYMKCKQDRTWNCRRATLCNV
jgi:hypothetical protein